ncbi:alpha/beta hydrolase [Gordonia sp. TBRC 11910]|uniref:Alpha/beta hydrolase n=1 Tax=Gordonia asplenii TaxID=2725283 RepID=A0A848KUP5_9ACTN|nr:alpha/beta hydrolase [Gordonia asplenii]NMO02406.1 alpha/beta hydrolase [Gordonia asplenii]
MFGKKKGPSQPPAALMKQLARRGRHRVLRGDLGFVGIPGQVFTPESGTRLPAVAFGHAWLADSARYRDLLFHLASWGIVVAAPDGQRGPFASDAALAADLRATLLAVANVPLGFDGLSVHRDRLGLVGHGFGAGAAVLAASDEVLLGQRPPKVRGVAAVFPAPTTSILLPAAGSVSAPTTVIAAGDELDTVTANALPLTRALGGDVTLRTIAGGSDRGLLEKRGLASLVGFNGADRKTHAHVRAVLTGFLLNTLADDPEYQAFADPEQILGDVGNVDPSEPDSDERDHFSKLVGARAPKRPASN